MNRERVTEKLKGRSSREDRLHPLRYGANGAQAVRGEVDYPDPSEYDDDDIGVEFDEDDLSEEYDDDDLSDEYQNLADLLDSRDTYRHDREY